jgi:hypothetical protein
LELSFWKFLQALPQRDSPLAHGKQLLPPPLQQSAFEHDFPLPHPYPQAPQLFESV